jgi:hypothetical protein
MLKIELEISSNFQNSIMHRSGFRVELIQRKTNRKGSNGFGRE